MTVLPCCHLAYHNWNLLRLARALQEEEDRQTAQAHQERDERERRRDRTRLPTNALRRAAPQAEGVAAGSSRKQKNGNTNDDGTQKEKKCTVM
jgi:hypothetical protein